MTDPKSEHVRLSVGEMRELPLHARDGIVRGAVERIVAERVAQAKAEVLDQINERLYIAGWNYKVADDLLAPIRGDKS